MWRKYGDDLYALLVLLVFSVEAVTLGALTWAFVLKLADQLDSGRVGALLVIGAHVLGYHALSSRRDRWRRERLDAWTERWVSVLFQAETPPTGPLSPEAEEALLDLRETLVGTEGERVEWLVRRYGLGEDLLYRSRAASRKRVLRPLAGLRRRRLSSRLEALESLAKARLASAIDPLIAL